MDPIQQLANWFESHCNGDWEHSYGVTIESLDNPGWAMHIDLTDTELSGVEFLPLKRERSKDDWIHCRVEGMVFHGYGGVHNLDELITSFLDWAMAAEEAIQPAP